MQAGRTTVQWAASKIPVGNNSLIPDFTGKIPQQSGFIDSLFLGFIPITTE